MANESRPNLFHYATSELSQDAFICWLAAWADPKFKEADPGLHLAGTDFIRSMLAKQSDYDVADIKAVKVSRQVGKLDVLVEINKPDPDAPGELAILIEDKTHTFDHGTQLADYYNHIKSKGYTEVQIIPLYFKTGYQSRFDTLGVFKTYLREDFLKVLRKGEQNGVKNAIFCDFLSHLEKLDEAVKQFSSKQVADWTDNDWQGLFMEIYERFKEDGKANWGYVPNASSGFFGFWWNFQESSRKDYWSYLQWEYGKLCFKIGFSDGFVAIADWKSQATQIKTDWWESLRTGELTLLKGTKIGKTMTVAKMDGIALCKKTDGTLDVDQMIKKMDEAQEVLKRARQKLV